MSKPGEEKGSQLKPTPTTTEPGRAEAPPVRTAEVKQLYRRPPSFTDLLPWAEYLPESRTFLLEDGISVGALFELLPVGTEARTPRFMAELRDAIQTALTDAVPEREDSPWILQVYVQDTPSLEAFQKEVAEYVRPEVRESAFSRHFQDAFAAHLARISRPGGLFTDEAVTGTRWRGQIRRVRAVLYRRIKVRGRIPPAVEVEADLNDVATKWIAALASAGIKAERGTGKDLYDWLLPWFNPRPEVTGGDAERLLEVAPYPGDENLPFGHDLAERLTLAMPESDNATATWWFDGLPHTAVTIQGLRRAPDVRHMTAERLSGDHVFALFDRLPEHTIMSLTLTVSAPSEAWRFLPGESPGRERDRDDLS
jgi:hypothetical protein